MLALAFALALPCAAPPADLVVTKEKHADAVKMPGMEQPAKDTREVMWIGADRLRVEEGDQVTLVRADLKKMYLLDTKAKTYSAIDLPLDMKKYMPAEMAPMLEHMASQVKVTVTPTGETREIQGWTATRFTMTMAMPMGSTTQEMWATKDVAGDLTGWRDMYAAMMARNPFAGSMAAEMKKVEGLVVLSETTQTMMGSSSKSREAVLSVEEQEAPAGHYDLPQGYTEKAFDPMAGMPMGGPGKRAPRGG
jgi:hypothetical protein